MATSARSLANLLKGRRSSPKAIVVRTSSSPARGAKAKAFLRRVGSAARGAAVREKAMIHALEGAAAIGALKRFGVDLPKIEALGTSGTYGIVLYAAGHVMKSTTLKEMSVGPLCIALAGLVASGMEGLSTAGSARGSARV